MRSNFGEEQYAKYVQIALSRFAKMSVLLVAAMWAGADLVASDLGILHRNGLYVLSSGWSECFAQYSVSHLVRIALMREAVIRGARETDLLSDAPDWKRAYSTDLRNTMDICIWPTRQQMVRGVNLDAAKLFLRRLPLLGGE